MDDGKINEIGTHDYLKDNNEIYREVYLQQTNDNGDFDKNGGEM
jgi:ATP-binding cassette subfamily B multidrug efflux pump